ncbi:MAG: histidine--tRNA ligase [Candidatus Parabeggiatoa sp. nov. 3]|nr:MAG: histidine--tRNA ligase [Gammaproteobacteria bacterium]RKZ68861.1 MAG: histidine--tRNA ligase [Gammaproteobacteria bacterium]RKZ89264.1 MAG: histidine--tRNA ligase [Gammaproteobacteria bacterium]
MTKTKQIPISGFPEFLPSEQIVFAQVMDIIRDGFERYGFSPIETPAVERKEVLISKGGNEKEIYTLSRLAAEKGEDPNTDLALHFDLTVPLARYVAQHKNMLTFPFRRYQIQKVWRGERAQAGRSREFYQCDIDVIGRNSLSLLTDAEIPSIIYQIFREMKIGPFVIRINNRKILQGYFQSLDIPMTLMTEVMRVIDKLEKIGTEKVVHELMGMGLEEATAQKMMAFLGSLGTELNTDEMLSQLTSMTEINAQFSEGVKELSVVIDGIRALGLPEAFFQIDLRIARGLDYYTGTVYETILVDHPNLGSICSGGRYDELASLFTDDKLPGVGISIGVTRLVQQLMADGLLKVGAATVAPVLVTAMDENRTGDYLRLGTELRNAGIATEVYLEKARLGNQLKYANKKGFKLAIIAGEDEFLRNAVQIKDLVIGEQIECAITDLVQEVQKRL